MKKIFIKVLCGLLAVSMLLALTACDSKKWQGTTMKGWGDVVSVGGFVAETENYLYYINGIGTSSASNKFGKPVKGALMAAEKSDLSKTEIVVPKLFVASDYSAGVFIFEDYVYYGTPSTDKRPDGTIASSEMMFMKTKLDGTDSKVLFTLSSLSTSYRIVENNGDVFVVYYDSANAQLVSRNVTKGTKTVIAETDATVKGEKAESLDKYFFVENGNLDQAVVLYSVTIYSEEYNKDKVEGGVARATENYNKVYAYKAGDVVAEGSNMVGSVVCDGKDKETTYAITLVDSGYVFYTATDRFANVKNYGATVEDFVGKVDGVEIVADYAASANVIKSLDEVYIIDSENGRIYQDTMVKADQKAETKKLVAALSTFNSLIDVMDGKKTVVKVVDGETVEEEIEVKYAYYYNSNNQIAKVELNNIDAFEIRVSEDSATQTWYAPEFIEIGGKTLMFYCDNSSTGLSYVKYVDINAEYTAEDTDEDDEKDLFYIEGSKLLGVMTDADKADVYEASVNKIASDLSNGALVFDVDEDGNYLDGKLSVKAVEDARAEYKALSASVKEKVSSSVMEKLVNYEKAIEMANKFYQLKDVEKYDTLNEQEKTAVKTAYDSVKGEIKKFYDSDYEDILSLIEQNLKAHYSKAVKLFENK